MCHHQPGTSLTGTFVCYEEDVVMVEAVLDGGFLRWG
jgi:hypothetical protein